MAYLTRDRFLQAEGFKTQELTLKDFDKNGDVTVRIRELSASESEHFSLQLVNEKGEADIQRIEGIRAKAIVWATIDEQGEPLLHKNDEKRIAGMPNRIIQEWSDAILKLSGVIAEDDNEESSDPKA